MRICLVTSVPFPPEEGLGIHVWNLAQELRRRGHAVEIITRGGLSATQRIELQGIPVWRPAFAPVYPFHVDVHGVFVNRLFARIASRFDVVNIHTPLPPPIDTVLPIVTTVHSPMRADTSATRITNLRSLALRLQNPTSQRIERALFRRSSEITAVAEWVARGLEPYGVQPERVSVTGNGVQNLFFDRSGVQAEPGTVLYVGRLEVGKGLEDLVLAVKRLQHAAERFRVIVAGKGPLLGRLLAMVAVEGVADRFVFMGHVSDRSELARLYRSASIFVLPSHHEGMPTVVLEAMASGLPVIATAAGGALEVVEDGRNGLLVPAGDPERLASAMRRLLNDERLRRTCSTEAMETVASRFSWSNVADRYLRVYDRAMEA